MKSTSRKPAEARPEKKAPAQKRRVFIVDDHPLFCQGITQMIDNEPDMAVCGEAEGSEDALEKMKKLEPDLAVVDVSLRGTSGIDLVKTLRALRPEMPVLVLSMHDESLYAERALRAGARGYVMKQAQPDHVMDAMRRVLAGDIYLSPEASHRLLHTVMAGRDKGTGTSSIELLSDRELQVFELLGKGRGTAQVAKELKVSIKTIEAHRAHIKTKLNLRTAPELVRAAVEWATTEARGKK